MPPTPFSKKILFTPRQPVLALNDGYHWQEILQYGISLCFTMVLSGSLSKNATVFPDGSVTLIIRCDDNTPRFDTATLYGSTQQAVDIRDLCHLQTGDRIFGVRFLPAQMGLSNSIFPGMFGPAGFNLCAFDPGYQKIFRHIAREDDFSRQIHLFMDWYLPHSQSAGCLSPHQQVCHHLFDKITRCQGLIKVNTLSELTGYPVNSLDRFFKQTFGLTPKKMIDIVRFQNVLCALEKNDPLIDIVTEYDYYDQSHLTRSFKKFTGFTPLKYKKAIDSYYTNESIAHYVLSPGCSRLAPEHLNPRFF